ncbi:MAG: nucleotide exchange factor GrpE [Methanimicrococcus sp.]|nr:nucleotide exchange factor GrpE [Methanimicrococcus sp.]
MYNKKKADVRRDEEFAEEPVSSADFMPDCSFCEDGEDGEGGADRGLDGEFDSGSVSENAVLMKKVEDLTSAYLTLAADFENYKKRNAKHIESVKKFAAEPLMKDLAEVADNFERALASANSGGTEKDSLMEGIKNTHRQFVTFLESHGLTKIPSEIGTEFDPHLHEAAAQVQTNEHPEETILAVHKPGYMLHGKVIRPATVTISVSGDDA